MYPRLPNIYKKFSGVEYAHWGWRRSRIEAQTEADILRAKGYKVRITKVQGSDGTFYAIWKNPITSIEFHREQEDKAKLNLTKMVERHSGTVFSGRY